MVKSENSKTRVFLVFMKQSGKKVRAVFSLRLVVISLFIAVAAFVIEYADFGSYTVVISRWKTTLDLIGRTALLISLAILAFNRLLYALDRSVTRHYLKYLDLREKDLVAQFISKNGMLDIPLDPGLPEIKQLESLEIIRPGTGLTYMAGDFGSGQHAYYSMPAWIFYFLKEQ